MRSVRSRSRRLELVATAALLLAVPATVSSTALGNPQMQALTATIPPPYSSAFDLNSAFSAWPALADVYQVRQDQKDEQGAILANAFWWWAPSGTAANLGSARAADDGTFSSYSEMQTPTSYADHLGVFGFVQWSQSFRKDSVDASYHYTMTKARLYTRCLTTGARAEFAVDNWAYQGNTPFYSFHQDGGVLMFGNPPNLPTVITTQHGPMAVTGSNPDGIQRDHQLDFGLHTEVIDLSSVPLGGEFTVVFRHMTQANIAYDEVVKASAYFRDPGGESLGVTMEVHGLTPTDNPQIPVLSAGPTASATDARLSAPRPNPAPGAVSFTLELPVAGEVSVDVFDLTGRRVASLARGARTAGTFALSWNSRDDRGALVPAGVYLVRATGPGFTRVQRVVRLVSK